MSCVHLHLGGEADRLDGDAHLAQQLGACRLSHIGGELRGGDGEEAAVGVARGVDVAAVCDEQLEELGPEKRQEHESGR